jgi:hypothetical protein
MAKKKVSKKRVSKNIPQKWQAVPLKGSFMITAILGFFISTYWVYPQSIRYGFAFMIVFAAMFIASLISMTKAPIINERY